jgi:hypothetical protein
MKMTHDDAYNLIVGTVEEKLAETVKRWGYTVPRVDEDRRVCWLLKEIEPWEIISITDKKRYIRLWRLTNYVRRVYPQLWIEPEGLVQWVSSRFVPPAIKAVVVALAKKALQDIEAVRVVAVCPSTGTLQLKLGTQTFYLDFHLRKTVWSWKIISEREISLATIRQPIAEHPINALLAVARHFGLLIL